MNRLITAFAAASLLAVLPAAPALAGPADADLGIVDFCKYDVPTNHPDRPLGQCIAFQSTNFRDNLNGLVPHLCSFLEAERPAVFDSAYDTFEECVRDKAAAFID